MHTAYAVGILVATVASCGDGRHADIDAQAPEVDAAEACFGTGIVKACFSSEATQPLRMSDAAIDTTDSSLCAAVTSASGTYCVIAATDITIDGRVRAVGLHPLVLLATHSITVTAQGAIDVGSHRAPAGETEAGAGADPAACAAFPQLISCAGGAGGSFMGTGGSGGPYTGAPVAGVGAFRLPLAQPMIELRGGCSGQDGAGAAEGRGNGGHGGGAVFLIAGRQIDVSGKIDAAGQGGNGGGHFNGDGSLVGGAGGGGGAGGMIGFDAPIAAVTGLLLANGGGGGQGLSPPVIGANKPGQDGSDATEIAAALGGHGLAGGVGGNGSAPTMAGPGGKGGAALNGCGGGGGGGAGLITAPATATLGTTLSPPVTPSS